MTEEVQDVNKQLQLYMNDGDVIISELASTALGIKNDFESQLISESEFKELLEDLQDLSQIDELAQSIERKAHVERAVKAIAKIVSMVL